MIRSRRLQLGQLDAWLVSQAVAGGTPDYTLRLWSSDQSAYGDIEADLYKYFEEALDDARTRIRKGFDDTLSPFMQQESDPAANYPARLSIITLRGYFGEVLAGLATEHWGGHGFQDWKIPAFLFRFHDAEFQHLDSINERLSRGEEHDPDADEEYRPGRTGDDAIAFRLDDENAITHVLTMEAKCLSKNRPEILKEAHAKLSSGVPRPSGIRDLINLLADYNSESAQAFLEALLNFYHYGYSTATRCDAVVYGCGRAPLRAGRVSWLSATTRNPAYTASRSLECLEFHLSDLDTVVKSVFGRT